MAQTTYKQLIESVSAMRKQFIANNAVDHLLPQEITALEALHCAPSQTIHYLNREQAINLLIKVEIGLTLEWHAKAAGTQK